MKFRILQRLPSFSTGSRTGKAGFRHSRSLLAVFSAAIMLAMVGSVFSSSSLARASNGAQVAAPVIAVGSVEVLPGQSASIAVVLSESPAGVSGFQLRFQLDNPAVADIVAVSLPDYGLTQIDLTSSSQVTAIAADLNGIINASSTNITLATLDVLGTGTGSTQLNVVVTAMDDDNGFSMAVVINAGTVSVANVAPVVDAGLDVVTDEGQAFTSAGSFTDSGIDAWTATVDYGDGASPQSLSLNDKQFELNHTYADDGSYTVTVTVTDSKGLFGTDTALATVSNVAPLVLLPSDIVVTDGLAYAGQGSLADPGADSWTAIVDYGDGSGVQTLVLNGKSIPLSHEYAAYGVYQVAVVVTDDEGLSGTSSFQVEIRHTCPTLSGSTKPSLDNDADFKCEDVNGNSRLDFSDVVLLFKSLDSPEVVNNADDFDFNGNGLLDMADLIALFQMVIA